jgi:hypothetical protein
MVQSVHDLFYDVLTLMTRNNVDEVMSGWTWAPSCFFISPATSINVAIYRALNAYKSELEVARSDFLDVVAQNHPEDEEETDRDALRLAWCEKIITASFAGVHVLRELDDANPYILNERFKSPSLAPRPHTFVVGVNSIHTFRTLFPKHPPASVINSDLMSVLERLHMCPHVGDAHAYVRIGFDTHTGACFWLDGSEPRPAFRHFNCWAEWAVPVKTDRVSIADGHVVHREREKTKAELAIDLMQEYGNVTVHNLERIHVERGSKRDAADVVESEPPIKRVTTGEN